MARFLVAAAVLALAASVSAACSAIVFGGGTSMAAVENQVLSSSTTPFGCYGSVGSGSGYNHFKAKDYRVAASDAAMTAAQESSLGFSKLTVPQGLQSYSMLYNGATQLALTCQSLADLYSGFSTTIGGGALTVPVARSDSSGTSYVFSSYLNLCTAGGTRPWPSTKVGEVVAWGSPRLVTATASLGVASYVLSHPAAICYVGTSIATTFVSGNVRIAATNNKAGQNYRGDSCSILGANPLTLPSASATWSAVKTIFAPGSGVCPMVAFIHLWVPTVTCPAPGPAPPAPPPPCSAVPPPPPPPPPPFCTAAQVKGFLTYVFSSSGQTLLAPLGFVACPSGLLNQDRNAVATIM